jgi:hypothetical protein
VPPRPKHTDKDFEALLCSLERQHWRVPPPTRTGYYKVYCPCGKHLKTIHLSPSDPRYLRNLMGWLKRTKCWKEDRR